MVENHSAKQKKSSYQLKEKEKDTLQKKCVGNVMIEIGLCCNRYFFHEFLYKSPLLKSSLFQKKVKKSIYFQYQVTKRFEQDAEGRFSFALTSKVTIAQIVPTDEKEEKSESVEEKEKTISIVNNENQLHKHLPVAIVDFLHNNKKRKNFDQLSNRQKKRRLNQLEEVIEFSKNNLLMTEENYNTFLKQKLEKSNNNTNQSVERINPVDALKTKDKILLSDASYQIIRNVSKNFPPLKKVKGERENLNQYIQKMLQVAEENGSIKANFVEAVNLIGTIHNTTDFKFTFDARMNEHRSEVLIALIPILKNDQHSPQAVYPLMIYIGKEKELTIKANNLIEEINTAIQEYDINIMITSDLKSFWTLTGGNFRAKSKAKFCPFCDVKKEEIEEGFKNKDLKLPIRSGTFGILNINIDQFVFCYLHAKLRITETLFAINLEDTGLTLQNIKKALAYLILKVF
jgi:hypothetical protein